MREREHPLSRCEAVYPRKRRLSRYIGGTSLAAAILLNSGLETLNSFDRPPGTAIINQEIKTEEKAKQYFPNTYWVIIPGRGIDFSADVERALAPTLHQTGQTFTISPNPDRYDPHEIASKIRSYVISAENASDQEVKLRFYGISMGSMVAWDVANLLDSRDNIEVDGMVFDSSPGNIYDVNPFLRPIVKAQAILQSIPDPPLEISNPIKGGPINRFVIHTSEAVMQSPTSFISPNSIQDNWRKANLVLTSQLNTQAGLIDSFDNAPQPDALPHVKQFTYIGARDYAADQIVNVETAVKSYQTLIGPNRRLSHLSIPQGSHASADRNCEAYNQAMSKYIADAGLKTITNIERDQYTRQNYDKKYPTRVYF